MLKIKRLLGDSYYLKCVDVIVTNQIEKYLAEKGIGGFDSDNKSAVFHSFHTRKVLKGIISYCVFNNYDFEVEF